MSFDAVRVLVGVVALDASVTVGTDGNAEPGDGALDGV